MLLRIFLIVVLIANADDVCHGLPLSDNEPSSSAIPSSATATSTTTTSSSIAVSSDMVPRLEPEAHPMDDLLPGTTTTNPEVVASMTESSPKPLGPLVFVDSPQHTETELGAAVLLACRTAEPVAECRWSWQPLPPTHLPLPNIDDSSPRHSNEATPANTTTSTTTTVMASASLSLPVRTFPAFGNGSNDCSVRFSSTKYEQTGYWSCAAKRHDEESFTSTSAAKLSIVHVNSLALINFTPQEGALETPAGTGARLPCRTQSPVRECQWSWRQLNQSQPWDIEMRKFPASGINNNDSINCDLGLPAVRSEHEGFWTCGARIVANSPFVQAPPIRLLISEVEFVQLSRGIQITAGETVFLRCLVNKPVYQCEWSMRPSNSSKNSTIVKKFEPSKEADHDCSVRFKNILYEEEGLWTCGVRLTPDGILHEAPSTTVTLLPSGKVNFTEIPENTSGAIGSEATIHCATNGRIERCTWLWRPLSNSADIEPTILHEFPSHGDLGRNCSLTLPNLNLDEQGYWICQVYLAGQNTMMTAAQAKLTVYEEEDVKFSELSQDIQVSSGGTVSLRCVTLARVEQCRWSLTPDATANTTVVIKQFPPAGTEARDCSVKLSHALQEQEGLWTCGARLHAKQNYTDAPPARLSLIEPEPITVTVWGVIHQAVNLACKTGLTTYETQCFWTHGEHLRLSVPGNVTRKTKHTVSMNHSTGVCSLQFTPTDSNDFGEWICDFVMDNEHVTAELGSASILLIDNSPDQQLGWLVGAITSIVLFLLIMVVVMVVCKTRLCTRKIPAFLETLPPTTSMTRVNGVAGNSPAKIDLSYTNPNFLASPENISNVLPNRSPHLYDRVGKKESPNTYENIKET